MRRAAQKMKFPFRISSVNVTKSAVSCGFGHIYWRNPSWKTSFFVQLRLLEIWPYSISNQIKMHAEQVHKLWKNKNNW